METKKQEPPKQQQRRARVDRIKRWILAILIGWFAFSLTAVVDLTIQTVLLHDRVEELEKNISEPDKAEEETGIKKEEEAFVPPYTDQGIDSPSNLAVNGKIESVYFLFAPQTGEQMERICTALEAADVRATFFVSGDMAIASRKIYRAAKTAGHTIGLNLDAVIESGDYKHRIESACSAIYQAVGSYPVYYQYSGGSAQIPAECRHILDERDMVGFDWNVSYTDTAGDITQEEMIRGAKEAIGHYRTSVVLFHTEAGFDAMVGSLSPLASEIKTMGGAILPVTEQTERMLYRHS